MKKYLLKTLTLISWRIEHSLGIYKDILRTTRIYDRRCYNDIKSIFGEITLSFSILGLGYLRWFEEMAKIKLKGLILSILKRVNSKKVDLVTSLEGLEKLVSDIYNIELVETELGYKYNNITESSWSIETDDQELRKLIILSSITIKEYEKIFS